jgi:hypothetical protein
MVRNSGIFCVLCLFWVVSCGPSFQCVVFRSAVSVWVYWLGSLRAIRGSANPLGVATAPRSRLPLSRLGSIVALK